ncbi:luciferase family oxidoreductase group 1 [Planomicrobium koreense]|uniref:Luciferase family oxidoreductase group 1 n=1 Tax=Planococcus koreensis TaxID=112331 RepID=A0A7W8FTV5_9BACL|nr:MULTISPECIES: LLM class flavin-dependent oxidoreductase [Planococcus]MBB5179197.1 luciferase family oxidoreductase group 1 [Planococcus koreensis]MDN3451240.1 LLM class flavin-dependent oxidoreductase [Planococcus sp. APC 3906]
MANKKFENIPLGVLDLAPINKGSDAAQSFKNSVRLAQHVEELGFSRLWLAEHHNMPGIGSSATSVLIGHIAGQTERIRVGSGGVMLPNHAPLVIAEQFGTLESLYPGRIDLGLGRAPGSDQATAYALRRTLHSSGDEFPQQVEELQNYFSENPKGSVRAFPGTGLDVPLWLLGSSGFSAQLAAIKGLPFSFASHFAPDYTMQALQLYHQNFKPSAALKEPYAMVGVNVIAADTQERAEWLATSSQQQMFALMRGMPTHFQPPIDDLEAVWSPREISIFKEKLASESMIVGTPDVVREKLRNFILKTRANEVIVNSQIFHLEDRLRSYSIVGDMMD